MSKPVTIPQAAAKLDADLATNRDNPIPEPAPKRPRTESPEMVAGRHAKEHRQIRERIQAEINRSAAKVTAMQAELVALDEKCKALPEPARGMFEKMVGAL